MFVQQITHQFVIAVGLMALLAGILIGVLWVTWWWSDPPKGR